LRTEAVVVGAGPAGLIAAREIARRGFEVKVLEEHDVVGKPNHCAGVLSVEGLRRLNVEPSPEFVQQEVMGGTLYSPGGASIRISVGRTRAYVVDRTAFDMHLADLAKDKGVEIETGHRVRNLIIRDGHVAGVIGSKHETESDLVIDGEGAGGLLARNLELPRPSEGVLSGVNAEVRNVDVEPRMVEVWLGKDLAQGLFAWIIPIGEDATRCGLACARGDAHEMLRGFLRRRFGDVEYSEPRVWPVLTGGPLGKTFGDGFLLVGDVAGHTKPTTGGGVIMGGLCAIEAAKTAAEALEAGDSSASFLSMYERNWRAALGKEFSAMLSVRRLLNKIPDERMDRLLGSLRMSRLEATLEGLADVGDMDMQSGVVRSALRHPGILRAVLEGLGRIALAELRALFNL
jgi:digeranylgeranylglycerophospholipid reductase